jgi:hypothetical protein
MSKESSLTEELAKEIRDMPPEVVQSLMELVRAVKHGLATRTNEAQGDQPKPES